jgi:hypothetical protein
MERQAKPEGPPEAATGLYYFMPGYGKPTAIKDVAKKPLALDVERIRADFPILQKKINGKQLFYPNAGDAGA